MTTSVMTKASWRGPAAAGSSASGPSLAVRARWRRLERFFGEALSSAP